MLVFGLACIWVAGMLAFEGQVTLRAGQPNELRLWLVEDGGPAGLGFSYSVSVDVPELENLACYQTRVRFVMWSDHVEGQPARYCRCYQSLDGAWVDAGACE